MENYHSFECLVVRVRGPQHTMHGGKPSGAWIHVDVYLPEKYAVDATATRFNPDGTYTVEVVVAHNWKSLQPFLASGDLEWDVKEQP